MSDLSDWAPSVSSSVDIQVYFSFIVMVYPFMFDSWEVVRMLKTVDFSFELCCIIESQCKSRRYLELSYL